MTDDKLWIATDLERLTPDFLARIRAKGRVLLEERGLVAPHGDGG